MEGETKKGEEANFVKIVFGNLVKKFGADLLVLRDAKRSLKANKYLRKSAPGLIDEASKIVRDLKLTESGQV